MYVQLAEQARLAGMNSKIHYWPEPASHDHVGVIKLRPDAYVETGSKRFCIEVDRGGEARNSGENESQLTQQMRTYLKAIDSGHWDEAKRGVFSSIIWTAHGESATDTSSGSSTSWESGSSSPSCYSRRPSRKSSVPR